jgi:hypothetical protein
VRRPVHQDLAAGRKAAEEQIVQPADAAPQLRALGLLDGLLLEAVGLALGGLALELLDLAELLLEEQLALLDLLLLAGQRLLERLDLRGGGRGLGVVGEGARREAARRSPPRASRSPAPCR